MKHHNVLLICAVAVKVKSIQAATPDEAARTALQVMTLPQLTHLFDRRVDDRIETHFTDDIPAIMVDEFARDPEANPDLEPAETHWRIVDVPDTDEAVFEAAQEVLRTYEGGDNPFASDDLKAKMEALDKALDAMPKRLAVDQSPATGDGDPK